MFEKVCVRLRLTPFKISIALGCHGSESYHSRRFLSERTATKGDAMKDQEGWRASSWESGDQDEKSSNNPIVCISVRGVTRCLSCSQNREWDEG